jgi:hypothetical protein
MTALQFDDVVLIEVEFHQTQVRDWRTAGLNVASTVRESNHRTAK